MTKNGNGHDVAAVYFLAFLAGTLMGCTSSTTDRRIDACLTVIHDPSAPSYDVALALAFYKLAEIGPPALTALDELLRDDDARVRLLAVRTVGGMGPAAERCVPTLENLLLDQDADVSGAAANTLKSITGDRDTL